MQKNRQKPFVQLSPRQEERQLVEQVQESVHTGPRRLKEADQMRQDQVKRIGGATVLIESL